MKTARLKRLAGVVLAGSLVLALQSCATKRSVDYAAYEAIPDSPASATYRVLAKSNPYTKKRAFYMNYGGPGNVGGKPVDAMDELFRRHDIVYHNCVTSAPMKAADEELVTRLREIDVDQLDPQAREFRERAIKFFESPISKVLGKPWSTIYRKREPAAAPFASRESVRDFFSDEHSGMLDPVRETDFPSSPQRFLVGFGDCGNKGFPRRNGEEGGK